MTPEQAAAAEFILNMLVVLGAGAAIGGTLVLLWGAVALVAYRVRNRRVRA
jgi:hypothetical protein